MRICILATILALGHVSVAGLNEAVKIARADYEQADSDEGIQYRLANMCIDLRDAGVKRGDKTPQAKAFDSMCCWGDGGTETEFCR